MVGQLLMYGWGVLTSLRGLAVAPCSPLSTTEDSWLASLLVWRYLCGGARGAHGEEIVSASSLQSNIISNLRASIYERVKADLEASGAKAKAH